MLAQRVSPSFSTWLFAVALLQLWAHTSGSSTGCPAIPVGTSTAHFVQQAVTCLDPGDISAPSASIGNVYLSGLHAGISSNDMKCISTSDGLTTVALDKVGGISSMTRGSHQCVLKSITAWKSDSSPTASAEMHLEYVNCTGVPTMGTVRLGLERVPDTQPAGELLKFFNSLCGVQTTSPPPQAVAKLSMSFNEVLVGTGACKGDTLTSYDNAVVKSKAVCRQLCIADIQKYTGMINAADACRGYAYNPLAADGKVCVTYKGGEITKVSNPKGSSGGNCWNVTETMSTFQESTAPPPSAEQLAQLKASAPKLKASIDAKSAIVQTYVSKDSCFPSFDWITLQAPNSQEATLKVKDSEWDELMKLIPVSASRKLLALSQSANLQAGLVVDHAAYSATPVDQVVAVGLTTTLAPATTLAPKRIVSHKDCVVPEVVNALLTGFLVPAATWAGVAVLFHRMGSPKSDGSMPAGCGKQTIMILVCCAFLTAAIASFVLVSVLAIVFKPMCESSHHDLTLIKLTSGITAMVASSAGLFYLSTKHHSTAMGKKERKYMIVEHNPEDGSVTALPAHHHVPEHTAREIMSSMA